MSDIVESDLIFKVHRVKNNSGDWLPAIQDVKSHDITPSWVAAMAYVILDRYISCVDECNQNKFQEEVFYWLNLMMKDNKGSEYMEKINQPEDLD
jgi:hypothetical protein